MTTIRHWKSIAILSRALALSIVFFVFPVLNFLFAQTPQATAEASSRDSYQAAQLLYAQSYMHWEIDRLNEDLAALQAQLEALRE